jgi:ribonuclease R
VPIRTLGTEYFNYDERRHALIGSRSGAMHRLGDVVDVRLVEAAPVAGALRFELLSDGRATPRGRKGREVSSSAPMKAHPGRRPPRRDKARKSRPGKPKKGKSWKG